MRIRSRATTTPSAHGVASASKRCAVGPGVESVVRSPVRAPHNPRRPSRYPLSSVVAAGRGAGPDIASGRAYVVLDQAVRRAASAQAVIDGFVVIAALTAVALAFISAHRSAPSGPASHRPLFAKPNPAAAAPGAQA